MRRENGGARGAHRRCAGADPGAEQDRPERRRTGCLDRSGVDADGARVCSEGNGTHRVRRGDRRMRDARPDGMRRRVHGTPAPPGRARTCVDRSRSGAGSSVCGSCRRARRRGASRSAGRARRAHRSVSRPRICSPISSRASVSGSEPEKRGRGAVEPATTSRRGGAGRNPTTQRSGLAW